VFRGPGGTRASHQGSVGHTLLYVNGNVSWESVAKLSSPITTRTFHPTLVYCPRNGPRSGNSGMLPISSRSQHDWPSLDARAWVGSDCCHHLVRRLILAGQVYFETRHPWNWRNTMLAWNQILRRELLANFYYPPVPPICLSRQNTSYKGHRRSTETTPTVYRDNTNCLPRQNNSYRARRLRTIAAG
jgi:hypothetical protein